ncbi:MAG: hypothetical protein COU85_02225 [Candidatus Portnoybacteria bacterium CG10_big_fil_rev_8_21_14_0_10_44_7]|uniref:Uncharacterized protein n=1 Tax=Candidatus Portnoybacteria bacterium CG10_big_fil_rev_8_21_14_0_10_44_7 TaxID=1974816 RepID=A0A2M8KIH9_9BACT|nr:MAG: hypothetical protein COU85_02225 [Candidatus Portnoybacteria bacterium CG10_big_fil_rev_8_21_14_0_10_44_7]
MSVVFSQPKKNWVAISLLATAVVVLVGLFFAPIMTAYGAVTEGIPDAPSSYPPETGVGAKEGAAIIQKNVKAAAKQKFESSGLSVMELLSSPGKSILGFLSRGVYLLLVSVSSFVRLFLILAAGLLNWTTNLTTSGFSDAGIVSIGWNISRSVVNMLFALILLAIAFATILRIEAYGAKKLLPKLILVALFINFSLFAGGVIIDFTHVLAKPFLVADPATQLARGLGINNAINYSDFLKDVGKRFLNAFSFSADGVTLMFSQLMEIIVLSVVFFVFIFLAILFLIRVIALWILLILAPIAWVFFIIPELSGIAKNWWKTFLDWAFLAPAASFFIFLALAVAKKKSEVLLKTTDLEIGGIKLTGIAPSIFKAENFLAYIVIIGLLIAAITVGKKLGGKGADIALAGMHGLRKFTGNKLYNLGQVKRDEQGKSLDGRGRRWAKNALRSFTRPMSYGLRYDLMKKAGQKSLERLDQRVAPEMEGSLYDQMTRLGSWGKIQTDQAGKARGDEIKRRENEFKTLTKGNPDALAQELSNTLRDGDVHSFEALTRSLFAEREQGKILEQLNKDNRLRASIGLEPGEKLRGDDMSRALAAVMGKKGASSQQTNQLLYDLSAVAKKTGDLPYANMATWNSERGGFAARGLSRRMRTWTSERSGGSTSAHVYQAYDKQGKRVDFDEDELRIAQAASAEKRDTRQKNIIEAYQQHEKDIQKLINKQNPNTYIAKMAPGALASADEIDRNQEIHWSSINTAMIEAVKKGKMQRQTVEDIAGRSQLIKSHLDEMRKAGRLEEKQKKRAEEFLGAVQNALKTGSFNKGSDLFDTLTNLQEKVGELESGAKEAPTENK